MAHFTPFSLTRSGSSLSVLAIAICTLLSARYSNLTSFRQMPRPMGCVPGPVPEDLSAADFTVTVVTRTAAHPWFGIPGAHPLAFSVNGTEGLVLNLVRGTTYTFAITTGPQHPVVFTNSMEGGFLNTAQVIAVSGTPATSGTVSFTPDATTPNLLYYNCNNHSYMGGVINVTDPVVPIQLSAKALLEGPYDAGTLLMWDSLRSRDLVPLSEPYSALGYVFIGLSGNTSVSSTVLDATGNNAIVDWVIVELRNAATPSTIVATHLGLIQRDGDIVDMDGTGALTWNLPATSYYIAVRHRNHLGAMTGTAVALSGSSTTVDLTDPGLVTYGSNARKQSGTKMLLWSGDATFNGEVKYTNSDNDRTPILSAIGGTVPTASVDLQYRLEDTNLDAHVKYTGALNDRDQILQVIGGVVPTNTRAAQLP